jgi:hypothetical protein
MRTLLEKLLRGRWGVGVFVASASGLRFLFLASYAGRTFVVDTPPLLVGDGKATRVGPNFVAQTHLQQLECSNLPSEGKVFEACVAAKADEKEALATPTTSR